MLTSRKIFWICAFFWAVTVTAYGVEFIQAPALNKIIKTPVGNVKKAGYQKLPVITWGGDIATILANGKGRKTSSNSILGQKGLKYIIEREDDFKKQIEAYLKGDTPFLRGTMGMINMAMDVISQDARTKPVIFYQLTWSNGGDCLVVKSGIHNAKQLKGKTIALQAYGPHVDYLAKILKDAGLSMTDVTIKWVKDLSGTEHSPAEALHETGVDAVFVIIPDGLILTSNGTVGTGSEESVKGARILLSTKTASRIISDVYVVRNDYFQSHKQEIKDLTHGLLLAQQELKNIFKNKDIKISEFKTLLRGSAEILLDSPQATADTEALYGDCEFVGFKGNVKFFGDTKWPRNMNKLVDEVQASFVAIGLLSRKHPIDHAKWNYDTLRAGLIGIDNVESPRFKSDEVARVVAKKQAMGTLGEGELFNFEIMFKPNQQLFSSDMYAQEFKKVVELASTYGGAIITVEGHSDPHKYNKLEKKGASQIVLTRTKQAAKNLSMNRSLAVRNSIIKYAANQGIPLDESQFTVIGHGINQPKFPHPKTKEQWLQNMRVMFRIIQIEAEDDVFEPL